MLSSSSKKTLRVLTILLLTLGLHLTLSLNPQTQQAHAHAATGFPHVQGAQIVDGNNQSLVLHGAMMESSFAYIAQWNAGVDPTKILNTHTFTAMRSWGMNALRINISQWIQQADTTGSYMQKLNQVVAQATQAGLYVIIDFHDNVQSGATGAYVDGMLHQTSLSWWKTIATNFQSNTQVMFDLINEPNYPDWCSWLYGGNAQGRCTSSITDPDVVGFVDVINAIRSVGAQQIIVVEPGKAGGGNPQNAGWATFDPTQVTDPNILYSKHEYQNVISGNPTTWDQTWGVLLGHYPIYYGEWSVLANAATPAHCKGLTSESADAITNTFLQYLSSRNANWTYWDFEPYHLIADYTKFTPTTFQTGTQWSCPNGTHVGPGLDIQNFLLGRSRGTTTSSPSATLTSPALLTKEGVAKVSAQSCGAWSVVASPNAIYSDYLAGVAAVSSGDVWAVGYDNTKLMNPNSPKMVFDQLIEHWNGSTWSIVSTPKTGANYNYLEGVVAVAANDVWAVGSYLPIKSTGKTLIEHWNGRKWNVVSSPNVASKDNYLNKVVAISSSDIWAVGYATNSSGVSQTLIEHWDGTAWSIVSSPNVGSGSNSLNDLAAVTTGDMWAVGSYYPAGSNMSQTLIEHWDGIQWSVVASPNVGTLGSSLSGVTAVSTNNVWAVGSSTQSGTPSNFPQTLIEHWNGTTWSVLSSPNVGSGWNLLSAATVVSTNDVWAVGYYQQGTSMTAPYASLTEHWNGSQWSVVSSPNAGSLYNYPGAVTLIPGTSQLWMVGNFATTSGPSSTLTEFYC